MAFLPQELLLLSISKDLSCKQDILGGSRYVSRKLYHHLPGEVGKKIAEFGVQGNPDLKHLQLQEQLILHPHLSSS
jgi:hypothetical protein